LNRSSGDQSITRPKTFAEEGWSPLDEEKAAAAIRDGEVKAASAEETSGKTSPSPTAPRQERSLLVPSH
jgi:hypothetical protein